MKPIKCILSDLGKVVVEYDNELTITRFAAYTSLSATFVRSVLFHAKHGLHPAFEAGALTSEEFRKAVRLACKLNADLEDDAFDDVYANIFTPMNDVIELWERLRAKGIIMTAVSNIDWIRWEPIANLGIPERFDHLILSCEQKLVKPSRELMIRSLDISGASAEESIFIDDKPENLEPAAKLGIRVHQYETYKGLLAFLEGVGLGPIMYPN